MTSGQSHSAHNPELRIIRQYRGEQAEAERLGAAVLPAAVTAPKSAQAPALLLAHAWDNVQVVTGWWMSEKLDGVRAYWDGQRFLSRNGNPFSAPEWFVQGLPAVGLDGELWAGRKMFQRASSIVRRQNAGEAWRQLKFVVFDAPAQDEPFERRADYLQRILRKVPSTFVSRIAHTLCLGTDHLRDELARLEYWGAEGIMLRQPASLYESGRSATLLKVKSFHDAEAVVVEHLPGTGRHKGRMGALLVQLANGKRFSVGTGFSDAQRNNPPPIGSVITFRYQELTDGGVPRFPSFVRVWQGSNDA